MPFYLQEQRTRADLTKDEGPEAGSGGNLNTHVFVGMGEPQL